MNNFEYYCFYTTIEIALYEWKENKNSKVRYTYQY
jgi:hypothetical protein